MPIPRIDRIQGQVMAVNSHLIHGPDGVVVIDGMLTLSDARLVREAVSLAGRPLAGLVITHIQLGGIELSVQELGPTGGQRA